MNIAITAEPIKCIGNRLSMRQASAAMPNESAIPGKSFKIFTIFLLYMFFLRVFCHLDHYNRKTAESQSAVFDFSVKLIVF